MRRGFFLSVGCILGATLALYLALERPSWVPVVGDSGPRLLVLLVGDRSGVDRVRRAVSPERIAASTPDAVALIEGRIVAVDAAAVSRPVNQAGWIDREIEIFHVERIDGRPDGSGRAHGEAGPGADPERLAKLRELANKGQLTAGEQRLILQAMNDGLQL